MLLNRVSEFRANWKFHVDSRCLGAFEDFLTTYESTTPDLTTDALESLNIDEDDLSDEYVMVDDERDGNRTVRRPGQGGQTKKKYMEMLQKVADRQISEVTIELDDLEKVCVLYSSSMSQKSEHSAEHDPSV